MSDEETRKDEIAASTSPHSGQQPGLSPVSTPSSAPDSGVAAVMAPRQSSLSEQVRPDAIDSDIYRLIWVLLRGWWIILIVVVLSVVYAGYSLTKFGPIFTAHMVVREISAKSFGIQLPSRLTGLAANYGVSLKHGSATSFDHFTVLLGATRFAEKLDRKYGYVKTVFGGQWNEVTQSWTAPSGWRVDLDNYFRRFAPIAEWTPPNAQTLAGYVAGNIQILEVQGQPDVHRIRFQHPDPQFALEFLQNVYQEAENVLYGQELDRVSNMVTYVKNRLSKITISEYRESLIFVLAGQEKRMIELQSGSSYVAQIIQPPVVSARATSPNVLVRLILGAIVGLALGGAVVLAVTFIKAVFSRRASRLAQ